jgi:HAMP domain-containing protein
MALALSGYLVVDRVSQEFETQERAAQTARTAAVSSAVRSLAQSVAGTKDILNSNGELNAEVRERFLLQDPELQQLALDVARADVRVRFGTWNPDKEFFSPAAESEYLISSDGAVLEPGEARDSILLEPNVVIIGGAPMSISIEVTLISPLTTRASRVAGVTGTITFVGILAMIVAIIVSTIAAARFAKPVQLLSETATEISEGNLSARVPTGIAVAANDEMVAWLIGCRDQCRRCAASEIAGKSTSPMCHTNSVRHLQRCGRSLTCCKIQRPTKRHARGSSLRPVGSSSAWIH